MTNQLQLRDKFVNPVALEQINQLATRFSRSGALPDSIKNGDQLAMVLMAGYEAGMSVMQSINSYYIVNGKITIYGAAVIQQLRRHGWKLQWQESTNEIATVTISKGQESHTETYTIEEAKDSGLANRSNWMKFPKEMLRHKAVGRAVRFACPEVLGGFYLKEEIEGVVVDVPPKQKQPETPKLDKKTNRRIHVLWSKFMELQGIDNAKWTEVRKAMLVKLFAKDSNNDLTPEEAQTFIDRINKRITELEAEQEAKKPPEDVKQEESDSEDDNDTKDDSEGSQDVADVEVTEEDVAEVLDDSDQEKVIDVEAEEADDAAEELAKEFGGRVLSEAEAKYTSMTKPALQMLLAQHKIKVPSSMKKAELVELAIAHHETMMTE